MPINKGWSRRFDEPIILPNGKKLVTLKDAIAWLVKEVPPAEHGMKQVQAAAHCVTAENNGSMIFCAHRRHDGICTDRGVSRSDARGSVALPAVRSGEIRPSALVAERPSHPP
jgi:hypothetical protein